MEYSKLSGYEKFILLSQSVPRVTANLSTYNEFKVALEALKACAKSDSKTMSWQDRIIEKPVTKGAAERALFKLEKNQWDTTINEICRALKIFLY